MRSRSARSPIPPAASPSTSASSAAACARTWCPTWPRRRSTSACARVEDGRRIEQALRALPSRGPAGEAGGVGRPALPAPGAHAGGGRASTRPRARSRRSWAWTCRRSRPVAPAKPRSRPRWAGRRWTAWAPTATARTPRTSTCCSRRCRSAWPWRRGSSRGCRRADPALVAPRRCPAGDLLPSWGVSFVATKAVVREISPFRPDPAAHGAGQRAHAGSAGRAPGAPAAATRVLADVGPDGVRRGRVPPAPAGASR